MALPLEAYALVGDTYSGDTYSAALVGNDGSIDWLCWPRFDSDACFSALLGNKGNGRWCVAPATLTLLALLEAGYTEEARAWRDWLLRAVAGEPTELQIIYGVAGERRLLERELSWLSGDEGSRPVRIGNAAVAQLQLHVFGEVMDCLHQARRAAVPADSDEEVWDLQRHLPPSTPRCASAALTPSAAPSCRPMARRRFEARRSPRLLKTRG